ncbi:hypothetical protein B0H10DRAFT_1968722 [Mycena sp. CBHHK59/15]|nr:hypothetical protein B0H10DRAFT_1968722 [Mycena sp. CBHHK59/15]
MHGKGNTKSERDLPRILVPLTDSELDVDLGPGHVERRERRIETTWESLETRGYRSVNAGPGAGCSRRALVVEGPEQSDHSDAPDLSDDDSFMNLDSPIPSPKAPQDYDSELELPTVEWRSPSPLEYIPDSDLPSTQIGPLLQSVPETEDLADHDKQENGSSAPATMPDAVSSAPTSSESAPPGITVTPNLGAEPTARCSGRKRKEREELKDLSAALSACICGSSAAPLDSSEHPNVAITWYDVVGWSSPRGLKNKNRHMFRHSQNGTPLAGKWFELISHDHVPRVTLLPAATAV